LGWVNSICPICREPILRMPQRGLGRGRIVPPRSAGRRRQSARSPRIIRDAEQGIDAREILRTRAIVARQELQGDQMTRAGNEIREDLERLGVRDDRSFDSREGEEQIAD
jgi:hypothetical protein